MRTTQVDGIDLTLVSPNDHHVQKQAEHDFR
jgi:hypothetical protein